eukprot:TCONS_00031914-protein
MRILTTTTSWQGQVLSPPSQPNAAAFKPQVQVNAPYNQQYQQHPAFHPQVPVNPVFNPQVHVNHVFNPQLQVAYPQTPVAPVVHSTQMSVGFHHQAPDIQHHQ